MREMVIKIVKEYNPEFSIHDFRMTDGGERINLIFDLVLPRENLDRKKIAEELVKKIHEKNKKYFAVIKVENSYV